MESSHFSQIFKILETKLGLDYHSIGETILIKKLIQIKDEKKINSWSDFLDKLEFSEIFFQELIDKILISESWFFRDETAFFCLEEISNTLLGNKETIKILSIPCGKGEEPFSILIELMSLNISPKKIEIDALDVSQKNIELAIKAEYCPNSFRSKLSEKHRSFFIEKANEITKVKDSFQQLINFERYNLLNIDTFRNEKYYDIIFCRNIFIYLTENQKMKTLSDICNLLNDKGFLFVGHSETNLLSKISSEIQYYKSFIFQKKQTIFKSSKIQFSPQQSNKIPIPFLHNKPKQNHNKIQAKSFSNLQENKMMNIEAAFEFADKGNLDLAEKICDKLIKQNKNLPRCFFLKGIIYQIRDDKIKATDYFRKTIYLEPENEEALINYHLLLDEIGELKISEKIKQRLKRIEVKKLEGK